MSLPNLKPIEARDAANPALFHGDLLNMEPALRRQPTLLRDADSVADISSLDAVFQLFHRITGQLVESYEELEARVGHLTQELSQAVERGRRQLEEKELLAQRLSTLLSQLPAGVIVLDGQGLVQQCNPAAVDLLGEPLEGQRWLDIIQRSFAPRDDDGHEVSLKDGRRVSISTRSMQGEPGQLILLHDLTETRELQAQLSRNERLSSMGRMVASLAHQIRTPLSAAMLYAGHLAQPELTPALRTKCSQKLMSRLSHLDQQVRDMLIFARGETRLAERMDISRLMQELQHAAEASLNGVDADCQWQDLSAGVEILCNREALVGALLNLIQNSIESSKSKPRIRVCAISPGKGYVNLEVQDEGAGFSPDQCAKVLDAFYTTKTHGTGLGLAVVQAVVKAHHGRFYLTSAGEGKGARAVITLPLFQPGMSAGSESSDSTNSADLNGIATRGVELSTGVTP